MKMATLLSSETLLQIYRISYLEEETQEKYILCAKKSARQRVTYQWRAP
jgi:hypothetical protein